ncbi:MAG: DNA-methyltransferase [Salinispira sp.]
MNNTQKITIRAEINKWVSKNFPLHRTHITHFSPEQINHDLWSVSLSVKDKPSIILGDLKIDDRLLIIPSFDVMELTQAIERLLRDSAQDPHAVPQKIEGKYHHFYYGDGIEALSAWEDQSIDFLLTDPPYGISSPYTCEKQVPRRLRKNGSDFIMPKGSFGEWDFHINPEQWTDAILPKVCGWAVIFCSHAQIGEYMSILKNYKFNSIGTFVWKKTNPVPFNHKFKPINSWESIVLGKRPGTKFNGHAVHNVFECKSPSPQERIHPTQKPLPLLNRFIELFSDEGDIVYDPFGGSASTLISCMRMKRICFSYEKDSTMYTSAYKRIQTELNRALKR